MRFFMMLIKKFNYHNIEIKILYLYYLWNYNIKNVIEDKKEKIMFIINQFNMDLKYKIKILIVVLIIINNHHLKLIYY